MMYKLKQQLKDVSNYSYTTFETEITKGFIVYIDSNGILNVYDINKQELLFIKKIGNNYGISFVDDLFFLRKKENELFKLDIVLERLEPLYKCSIKENVSSSIGVLSKDLVIETQSKIVDFNIVEQYSKIINTKTFKTIYSWNGLELLIEKEGDAIYWQSLNGSDFAKRNIITNKDCYNILLDNGSFGQRIIGQTKDFFYLQRAVSKPNLFNVLALEKSTGKIVWETENTHYYYCFDKESNKLFGLGGNRFEVINVNNGKKELIKDVKVNGFISSHLTYYNDGFLYFSTHIDKNIPVFGAVNVITGELDFIQEVKIDGEKSFRIGLEKPIVVDNRLYVKDSLNTLHIFEKTTPTPTGRRLSDSDPTTYY